MAQKASRVDEAVSQARPKAVEFLQDILTVASVEGAERDVQEKVAAALARLGLEVHFTSITEKLRQDPEFTPGAVSSFAGRFNLIGHVPGTGGGRSLIINTHSDIVPALGWPEAFEPHVLDGSIWGRGAADAKGQIATIYMALAALRELDMRLVGDLEVEVVIDEEIGGNGTLALLRSGHTADGVIVMEPTSLRLHPASRGALWFRFIVSGEAAHMARKFEVPSAVDYSFELINILYRYERELLERARSQPLFSVYKNPVQVNIGRFVAGDWPSTVPARAVVDGGIGFLPDMTIEEAKRELSERVDREASGWLRSHYTLEYPGLHNEAFQTSVDSPLVTGFSDVLQTVGLDSSPTGWPASCDARLFSKLAGVDTIIFGPGDLALAHSEHERLDLDEMETAARALLQFITSWCG